MKLLYLVRIDCRQRYEGLVEIFAYMARHNNLGRSISVYEVDAAPYPGLAETCLKMEIDYTFFEDHDQRFHRTKWSNKMVRETADNVIAICHADVLVPVGQILAAERAIAGGEKYVAAFGDERDELGLMRANARYLEHLQAGGEINAITVNDTMLDWPHKRRLGSYSGMVFLNRAFYVVAGMDDENIIGWGPEEVERHVRLTALGSGYRRIPGWAAHMPHPTAFSTAGQRTNNEIEFNRMHSMDADMIRQEVKRWKQIRGY